MPITKKVKWHKTKLKCNQKKTVDATSKYYASLLGSLIVKVKKSTNIRVFSAEEILPNSASLYVFSYHETVSLSKSKAYNALGWLGDAIISLYALALPFVFFPTLFNQMN